MRRLSSTTSKVRNAPMLRFWLATNLDHPPLTLVAAIPLCMSGNRRNRTGHSFTVLMEVTRAQSSSCGHPVSAKNVAGISCDSPHPMPTVRTYPATYSSPQFLPHYPTYMHGVAPIVGRNATTLHTAETHNPSVLTRYSLEDAEWSVTAKYLAFASCSSRNTCSCNHGSAIATERQLLPHGACRYCRRSDLVHDHPVPAPPLPLYSRPNMGAKWGKVVDDVSIKVSYRVVSTWTCISRLATAIAVRQRRL